jgi:hypothetical protein
VTNSISSQCLLFAVQEVAIMPTSDFDLGGTRPAGRCRAGGSAAGRGIVSEMGGPKRKGGDH